MTPIRTVLWVLSVVFALFVGIYVGRRETPAGEEKPQATSRPQAGTAARSAGFTLEVEFDGGYVYDFRPATGIPVHAIKQAKHPMIVEVVKGRTTESVIDVNGYALTLRPEGSEPAAIRPELPPLDPSQTGCNKRRDASAKNNRLFIPSLSDAAAAMGASVKEFDTAATIHLSGGGRLSVDDVAGCTEYRRDGKRLEGTLPRSMADGHSGIKYEWTDIAASTLELHRRPLVSGSAVTSSVTPEDGLIVLHVSSFLEKPKDTAGEEHELDHFSRHLEGAFNPPSGSSTPVTLWWLHRYFTSPSIDCPSGYIQ